VYLSKVNNSMSNPLLKHFRKPTAYIQLPTRGIFNPEIEKTVIDEVPILPMTAIDEIGLKNPDALLNGEALVNIIRSCVPSIPDPYKIPNIDAEALYLAIRYATYGKDTTHTHTCSKCSEVSDFNIDINYILSRFPVIDEAPKVSYDGLTIHIRPNTLRSIMKVSIIEAEQTKLINFYASPDFEYNDEESAAKRIYDSFRKIAIHNVDVVSDAILKIEEEDGNEIDDQKYISEFLNNVPSSLIVEIQKKVKSISKLPEDASVTEFQCPACNHSDKVKIEFNPVNFSVAG
jgi:hypothetical protein